MTGDKMVKTEQEWREILTPEQYHVLREKGTERPFTGKYVDTKTGGTYVCAACGQELFESGTKFDSHCGWPSFYDAKPGTVDMHEDRAFGMRRIEVTCARCGSPPGPRLPGRPQAHRPALLHQLGQRGTEAAATCVRQRPPGRRFG